MKKEKWYNKKLPIQYVSVLCLLMFLCILFIPQTDIVCEKSINTCTLYTHNTFSKRKYLTSFYISDITDIIVTYDKHRGRGFSYDAYYLSIVLKDGRVINLDDIQSRSEDRANYISNQILNRNYFELNGNYWNSLLNNY